MSVYQANDFLVNLPEGFKDRTINVFSLSDEGPSEVGIVVVRDRLKRGEDLDGLLDRQLALIVERMPLFRLLRRESIVVDKQPARLTDCVWHPPEGQTFQRQVAVVGRGGNVLLASVTCRDALSSKAEALFTEFLAGFRLRT